MNHFFYGQSKITIESKPILNLLKKLTIAAMSSGKLEKKDFFHVRIRFSSEFQNVNKRIRH